MLGKKRTKRKMGNWYQANVPVFLEVNSFRYAGLYIATLVCLQENKTKQNNERPIDGDLGIERSNLRTRKQRQNTAAHLALMYYRGKYDILTIFLKICILEYFDWRTYVTALCIKRMKHLSLDAEKTHSNGKKLYFFMATVSFSGRCNIKPMASQNTQELEHPWVWKEGKYTL